MESRIYYRGRSCKHRPRTHPPQKRRLRNGVIAPSCSNDKLCDQPSAFLPTLTDIPLVTSTTKTHHRSISPSSVTQSAGLNDIDGKKWLIEKQKMLAPWVKAFNLNKVDYIYRGGRYIGWGWGELGE